MVCGVGGNGGSGGTGLLISDPSGATFTVDSTVQGGAGGDGGPGSLNGHAGAGGPGIVGGNLDITINGSVSGGLSGDGVTRANAITFNGGTKIGECDVPDLAGCDLHGERRQARGGQRAALGRRQDELGQRLFRQRQFRRRVF